MVRKRDKWNKGKEKLLYWGMLYGTILGATFAAMYPNPVGRLVIDGVANATQWYAGDFTQTLGDADSAMATFFKFCHEAGPDNCPFAFAGSSPDELEVALQALIADLPGNPYAVEATETRGPQLIGLKEVQGLITSALYFPGGLMPLATGIAEIIQRNGSFLGDYTHSLTQIVPPPQECWDSTDTLNQTCFNSGTDHGDVTLAIMCSDGADLRSTTKEEANEVLQTIRNASQYVGDHIGGITTSCIHGDSRPKWRSTGKRTMTLAWRSSVHWNQQKR